MNTFARCCIVLLLSLSLVETAGAGLPAGPPPTPTPVVTLSLPPRMPYIPPPGRPSFSTVMRDEGKVYKVYVTVEKASPKDVQVTIKPKELKLLVPPAKRGGKAAVKLVSLPDSAVAKVTKVERDTHTLTISIPKAAK